MMWSALAVATTWGECLAYASQDCQQQVRGCSKTSGACRLAACMWKMSNIAKGTKSMTLSDGRTVVAVGGGKRRRDLLCVFVFEKGEEKVSLRTVECDAYVVGTRILLLLEESSFLSNNMDEWFSIAKATSRNYCFAESLSKDVAVTKPPLIGFRDRYLVRCLRSPTPSQAILKGGGGGGSMAVIQKSQERVLSSWVMAKRKTSSFQLFCATGLHTLLQGCFQQQDAWRVLLQGLDSGTTRIKDLDLHVVQFGTNLYCVSDCPFPKMFRATLVEQFGHFDDDDDDDDSERTKIDENRQGIKSCG